MVPGVYIRLFIHAWLALVTLLHTTYVVINFRTTISGPQPVQTPSFPLHLPFSCSKTAEAVISDIAAVGSQVTNVLREHHLSEPLIHPVNISIDGIASSNTTTHLVGPPDININDTSLSKFHIDDTQSHQMPAMFKPILKHPEWAIFTALLFLLGVLLLLLVFLRLMKSATRLFQDKNSGNSPMLPTSKPVKDSLVKQSEELQSDYDKACRYNLVLEAFYQTRISEHEKKIQDAKDDARKEFLELKQNHDTLISTHEETLQDAKNNELMISEFVTKSRATPINREGKLQQEIKLGIHEDRIRQLKVAEASNLRLGAKLDGKARNAQQVEEAEAANTELKSKLRESEELFSKQEALISALAQKNRDHEKHFYELEKSIEKAASNLTNENESLKEQLQEVEDLKKQADIACEKANSDAAQMSWPNENLQLSLSEEKDARAKGDLYNQKLTSILETQQAKFQTELQSQAQASRQEIDSLEQDLKDTRADNEKMTEHELELDMELCEAERQIKKFKESAEKQKTLQDKALAEATDTLALAEGREKLLTDRLENLEKFNRELQDGVLNNPPDTTMEPFTPGTSFTQSFNPPILPPYQLPQTSIFPTFQPPQAPMFPSSQLSPAPTFPSVQQAQTPIFPSLVSSQTHGEPAASTQAENPNASAENETSSHLNLSLPGTRESGNTSNVELGYQEILKTIQEFKFSDDDGQMAVDTQLVTANTDGGVDEAPATNVPVLTQTGENLVDMTDAPDTSQSFSNVHRVTVDTEVDMENTAASESSFRANPVSPAISRDVDMANAPSVDARAIGNQMLQSLSTPSIGQSINSQSLPSRHLPFLNLRPPQIPLPRSQPLPTYNAPSTSNPTLQSQPIPTSSRDSTLPKGHEVTGSLFAAVLRKQKRDSNQSLFFHGNSNSFSGTQRPQAGTVRRIVYPEDQGKPDPYKTALRSSWLNAVAQPNTQPVQSIDQNESTATTSGPQKSKDRANARPVDDSASKKTTENRGRKQSTISEAKRRSESTSPLRPDEDRDGRMRLGLPPRQDGDDEETVTPGNDAEGQGEADQSMTTNTHLPDSRSRTVTDSELLGESSEETGEADDATQTQRAQRTGYGTLSLKEREKKDEASKPTAEEEGLEEKEYESAQRKAEERYVTRKEREEKRRKDKKVLDKRVKRILYSA